MKSLLLSFPLVFALVGCVEKDDGDDFADADADADAGADADADDTGDAEPVAEVSDAPGCYQESVACNAFTGPGWAGQEEASCEKTSENSIGAGGLAYVYVADGCPDGPFAICNGLYGVDEDGNPVEAAAHITYFYSGISADQAQASCEGNGGVYGPF